MGDDLFKIEEFISFIKNVELSGSICMEGPYDLSGTMLDVMLSDDPFPVPYFLPLMLVGYNTIYSSIFDYDIMLMEAYRTNIPRYTNGFYSKEVVDSIMPQSGILKEVLKSSFILSNLILLLPYPFLIDLLSYLKIPQCVPIHKTPFLSSRIQLILE